MSRIKKIKIDMMRDTIIVEKNNGDRLEVGTRFFCGCCGNMLGVLNKELTFPFSSLTFRKSLSDESFTCNIIGKGLRHSTCGHTMFMFATNWGFSTLEMYYGWQAKEKLKNGSGDNKESVSSTEGPKAQPND